MNTRKKTLGTALGLGLLLLVAAACDREDRSSAKGSGEELERLWGVRVESLRLTAGGSLLDLRLRILDQEKARPLFDHKNRTTLVEQETGFKSAVPNTPKVGPLRTSQVPHAGQVAFLLFANPTKVVHTGSKVDVFIGDFSARNLMVE